MSDPRTPEQMADRELLLLALACVRRTEAKLDRLLVALSEEEDGVPECTLDGEPMPRERDQNQSLG